MNLFLGFTPKASHYWDADPYLWTINFYFPQTMWGLYSLPFLILPYLTNLWAHMDLAQGIFIVTITNFWGPTSSLAKLPVGFQYLIPFLTSPPLGKILSFLGLNPHKFVLEFYPKRPHAIRRWIVTYESLTSTFPKQCEIA